MAFDPDAYLAAIQQTAPATAPQQPNKPFDPDAYLAAMTQSPPQQPTPEVSKLASFGRGFLQSGTLGFADEISGGIESIAGSLGLTDVDKTYEQARDESRANFQAAATANPLSSAAGNVAGSLATAMLPIPGLSMASGGVAQAAKLGAKLGAIEGAGRSEANSASGVVEDVVTGAGTGALFGGGAELAVGGLKAAGRFAKDELVNAFNPTLQRLKAFGATPASIKKAGGLPKLGDSMDEFVRRGGLNV